MANLLNYCYSAVKDKVTTRSSDSEVEKVLREEVKAAIDNS